MSDLLLSAREVVVALLSDGALAILVLDPLVAGRDGFLVWQFSLCDSELYYHFLPIDRWEKAKGKHSTNSQWVRPRVLRCAHNFQLAAEAP